MFLGRSVVRAEKQHPTWSQRELWVIVYLWSEGHRVAAVSVAPGSELSALWFGPSPAVLLMGGLTPQPPGTSSAVPSAALGTGVGCFVHSKGRSEEPCEMHFSLPRGNGERERCQAS